MEEEIDLIDMIKYFASKKIWFILVGIMCIILAVIYTKKLITPEYTATAAFILTNDDLKTEADVYSYAKLPDRYFAIVNSRTVLDKVITNLKIDDIEDIEKFKENNIEIVHSPANFLVKVTVTLDNAKEAADIANEIVRVSIEEIKNTYKDEKIQILDIAQENWEPVNIELISNVLIFVLIGECAVCGYILIIYMFIKPIKMEKIKRIEEKERITKEYEIKENDFISEVNKTQKYVELLKARKELEKNIKVKEYKKVLEINDKILKYYAEEAYIAGYMDAKKSNEELVKE